jgi:hypothetical protein
MTPMKKYVAELTEKGVEVLISHSQHPDDTTPLQQLPGGYEWGYEGAGPTRLAYALLSESVASRFCDGLMNAVISKNSPIEKHEQTVVFHEAEILKWLRDQLNEMDF